MFQILYRFLAIGMDVVPAAVIMIPVILIIQHMLFYPMKISRKLLAIIFGIYLAAVFSAVGIPSVTAIRIDLTFNLIPLIDMVNDPFAYLVNTLLNILLFIPLGFLMPAIWKEYQSMKKVVWFGFGLSALVEVLQMFTYRLTDIDDLIFNTIGAAAGYYIYILFLKFKPVKKEAELTAAGSAASEKELTAVSSATSENRLELPIIFATAFLIMFLVQPVISGALWSVII